jgi:hypothetical protein
MEKQLERDKDLEQAREKVGDPVFDRAARRRYWAEYWGRLLFGAAIGVLAVVSYIFVRVLSEPAALAIAVLLSLWIVLYLFILRPQTCGACRAVLLTVFRSTVCSVARRIYSTKQGTGCLKKRRPGYLSG